MDWLSFVLRAIALLATLLASIEGIKKTVKTVCALSLAIMTFVGSLYVEKRHKEADRISQSKTVAFRQKVGAFQNDLTGKLGDIEKLTARGLHNGAVNRKEILKQINKEIQELNVIVHKPISDEILPLTDSSPMLYARLKNIESLLTSLVGEDIPGLNQTIKKTAHENGRNIRVAKETILRNQSYQTALLNEQISGKGQIDTLLKRSELAVKQGNTEETRKILGAIRRAVFELSEY